MCGINGVVAFGKDQQETARKVVKMNDVIVHRGPDDFGEHFENTDAYSLGMGMRRLSIIDIKSGHQPMYSDDQQIVICFNGEIYNFPELKKKLVSKGVSFKTSSDTEVVLRMYEKEGAAAFHKLDGMFAFSIYDKTIDKIFIVRDFFGEKPLYYSHNINNFIWASELKSIISFLPQIPAINHTALSLYFQLTYIPAPFTIYEGVCKLEANHYIQLDCKSNTFTIYEIEKNQRYFSITSKIQALKLTHDLVHKSVNSRSISDVPLGTFLSGGVDSSIVSLCLAQQSNAKINTFSVGFEKTSFDESDKARVVSKILNSNHHEFIISEKDLIANIHEIISNFDEPFSDSSALASFLVAKKTKDFVKVALTGDGGDEVFGGYNKYYMGKLNETYTSIMPQKLHHNFAKFFERVLNVNDDDRGLRFKFNRMLKAIDYNNDFYFKIISLGFQNSELNALLSNNVYSPNSLSFWKNNFSKKSITDFRNIDKHLSLEGDMLVKVDRTSMLASLECRAPFLNKELWDFANQLPESYLINGWDKKHILKEAFKQYFPKGFFNKSKMGFGVPVGDWLRSELKLELLFFTEKTFLEKQNIFQFNYITNLVNNHLEGKIDNTFRVWTFYCFQKWYSLTYND